MSRLRRRSLPDGTDVEHNARAQAGRMAGTRAWPRDVEGARRGGGGGGDKPGAGRGADEPGRRDGGGSPWPTWSSRAIPPAHVEVRTLPEPEERTPLTLEHVATQVLQNACRGHRHRRRNRDPVLVGGLRPGADVALLDGSRHHLRRSRHGDPGMGRRMARLAQAPSGRRHRELAGAGRRAGGDRRAIAGRDRGARRPHRGAAHRDRPPQMGQRPTAHRVHAPASAAPRPPPRRRPTTRAGLPLRCNSRPPPRRATLAAAGAGRTLAPPPPSRRSAPPECSTWPTPSTPNGCTPTGAAQRTPWPTIGRRWPMVAAA